ncbi:hypothetical protein BDR26DRAFT_853525 [Obelidium mucronatum]|nr:hypothetical protein BDR26DRAFT_853525 [Obelidium mucronatum]
MLSNVNPSRLRKTAKAAAHNKVTGLSDHPAAVPDNLPKGRRAREKIIGNSANSTATTTSARVKSIAAGGIDYPSFLLYGILSILFWFGVIGWWLDIPLLDYLVFTPLKLLFKVVTFPVTFPVRMVYKLVDFLARTFAEAISGSPDTPVNSVLLQDIIKPVVADDF